MRDQLDRFYTKTTVAKQCIDEVFNISDDFDLIVEPSAGSGSFSKQIPNCQAFDLSPTDSSITQKDWLTVAPTDFEDYDKMLVIGNPPFGVRSVIAKEFIKHSIHVLHASTIAFILPKTFNKKINQKLFPNNWRLIKTVELDKKSSTFELYEEDDIFIPCDFFIWTSRTDLLPEINLRKKEVQKPDELIFIPRGSEKADFSINGNNGKVKELEQITNPKAEHYVQVNPLYDKIEIKEFIKTLTFSFHSSVNGGVAWINKDDISETFNETKRQQNVVFAKNDKVNKIQEIRTEATLF